MIFTSDSILLFGLTNKSGKSGFPTRGVAAQKKLYAVEHVPSTPGEWGLFFPLFPLPLAPVGIPPSFPEMAHSGTVHSGHHRTTGTPKRPQKWTAWATAARISLSAHGFQITNWLKTFPKIFYDPKGQLCTKENESP